MCGKGLASEMTVISKTRVLLEGLVKDGSSKWFSKSRSAYQVDFEEMGTSTSAVKNWLPELSPVANVVVRRCSRILNISMGQLQEQFEEEVSESIKHPSHYARNFLQYCSFRALELSIQAPSFLDDKKFRRLTFDMMVAWEVPAAASQPLLNMDRAVSVGSEAFARIAPAVAIISNVFVSDTIFEVLTSSTGGRLQFSAYDKYVNGLAKAVKRLKSQSDSSLLAASRLQRGEKVIEVDGTVTSQPVLEHVGTSVWPGRLVLTDYALYFEAHCVVSFDKPKTYDLSDELDQVVRPELTGPWGTRLFDKRIEPWPTRPHWHHIIYYRYYILDIHLSEPVLMEFPELKGHTRRDYWLSIIREVLLAHRFINKFQLAGVQSDEVLLNTVFGILRLQALKDMTSATPFLSGDLLMFNVCDKLPGGDSILETFAKISTGRELEHTDLSKSGSRFFSRSALVAGSTLGVIPGTSFKHPIEAGILFSDVTFWKVTPLEKAIEESRRSHKKLVLAQTTVDGVKLDGIETNLALMKELLFPAVKLGNRLISLVYWDDFLKSTIFCLAFTYIIIREWLACTSAILLVSFAAVIIFMRCRSQPGVADELKVVAPPAINKMEQLMAVQNVISQVEELIQDGNVILLKIRGLLLSMFPQATEKCVIALVATALVFAFMPGKYIVLLVFLEMFTKYSPLRRASTERSSRRLREWWFSVPAAPVLLERSKEDKKKR